MFRNDDNHRNKELRLEDVIHRNNDIQLPSTPHGKVFHCGYNLGGNSIFPDYEYIETKWDPTKIPPNATATTTTTTNDILVYGMHGKCSIKNIMELLDTFHGKILYINGEPFGNIFHDNKEFILQNPNQFQDRVYQIGPYPYHTHTNTNDHQTKPMILLLH